MSELIPVKGRNKDPLEALQIKLFSRQAPSNASLIPDKKIPSFSEDVGNVLDDVLMSDRIGGQQEATGQALPGMAAPFGRSKVVNKDIKSMGKNILESLDKNVDKAWKVFIDTGNNYMPSMNIRGDIVGLFKRIKNDMSILNKKLDYNRISSQKFQTEAQEKIKGHFDEIIDDEINPWLEYINKKIDDFGGHSIKKEKLDAVLNQIEKEYDDYNPRRVLANLIKNANDKQNANIPKLKAYGLNDIEIKSLSNGMANKDLAESTGYLERFNLSDGEKQALVDVRDTVVNIKKTFEDQIAAFLKESDLKKREKIIDFIPELNQTAKDRIIKRGYENKKERSKRGSNTVIPFKKDGG